MDQSVLPGLSKPGRQYRKARRLGCVLELSNPGTMKKVLLIWLLLAAFCPGFAQPAERVYLATDRDWYAAGETIYL